MNFISHSSKFWHPTETSPSGPPVISMVLKPVVTFHYSSTLTNCHSPDTHSQQVSPPRYTFFTAFPEYQTVIVFLLCHQSLLGLLLFPPLLLFFTLRTQAWSFSPLCVKDTLPDLIQFHTYADDSSVDTSILTFSPKLWIHPAAAS